MAGPGRARRFDDLEMGELTMQPYPKAGDGPGQGGPMPTQPGEWTKGVVGGRRLAPWGWRLLAALIDYGPVLLVGYLLSKLGAGAMGWFMVIVAILVNSAYMQGLTGQSIGKRLCGMRLAVPVVLPGGDLLLVLPGVARCAWRLLAHLLDLLPWPPFCLGLLRPGWERYYRTFGDSVAKTVVLFGEGADIVLEPWPLGAAVMKI
jgi:hypothetical protein